MDQLFTAKVVVMIYQGLEASSVLLHRTNNVMSPTGVYTCKIPDNSYATREMNVYLYAGQLTGKKTHDSNVSAMLH